MLKTERKSDTAVVAASEREVLADRGWTRRSTTTVSGIVSKSEDQKVSALGRGSMMSREEHRVEYTPVSKILVPPTTYLFASFN